MMHVVITPKVWLVKVRICWNQGCPMFGQVLVGLSSWNPSGTGWQVGRIRSKLLVGFPVSFQGILLCNNALHWLTSGMHTPCNACLRISQLQVTKRSCSPKKTAWRSSCVQDISKPLQIDDYNLNTMGLSLKERQSSTRNHHFSQVQSPLIDICSWFTHSKCVKIVFLSMIFPWCFHDVSNFFPWFSIAKTGTSREGNPCPGPGRGLELRRAAKAGGAAGGGGGGRLWEPVKRWEKDGNMEV